jgi:HAE1 family hydrophobic/amphiphilic exporter-1
MFSRFFIARPIFANVIAIVTVLFGLLTLARLPVEQYPQITPPTVQVTTNYPGANADVVAKTVAAPIEQQVVGVENALYLSSTSASDGSYTLTVTFEVGTNLDMAQVLVQNRVAIAEPQLPDEVKRQGITTKKQSTSILFFVVLSSPDGSHDSLYLSNYATINIRDKLSAIKGVGDVKVVGAANYSMRVWLDPEKLKARELTAQDVYNAIQEQNVQVAAGQIGGPPTPKGQDFQLTITTLGRLESEQQFADIIVKTKTGPASRITRIKDVGSVERGGQVYDQYFLQNGKPASGIAVYQLPGANALQVADAVRKKMEELKPRFPQGVEYSIPFDTTKFVRASIHEVYQTLFEAGVLVLVVILVFLQDLRAVLVPATTVPVTIIGAFAAMFALGFTVNMLTLFGLILAIGIVVDDAIVIVENAAHHIATDRVSPKEATIRAMDELLGPIIGITLVLSAVFLPTAFQGGITGQLYRQFALTIAATAVISAINALTLKPAQCATYLRPYSENTQPSVLGLPWHWFCKGFNYVYGICEHVYARMVRGILRMRWAMMLLFAALVAVTFWGMSRLPTGFLPTEDQGYVIVSAQLPDAASQERTREVVDRVIDILLHAPGVENVTAIGGNSVLDGTVSSNAATFYVVFKDWEERGPDESQDAILAHIRKEFAAIQEAIVFAFAPPAIQGLGVAGGFQMQIKAGGDADLALLGQVTREMIQAGRDQSNLRSLNTTFSAGVPQLYADVDRTKAKSRELPLSDVFAALQTYLGSAYVNDFNIFGRTYQVRVQADAKYRLMPDDIKKLEVRNLQGKMVPLGSVVQVEDSLGPQLITRYNLSPAASITGEAAAGVSSGQALSLMEQMAADKLPRSMDYEWTGMSYQEKRVATAEIAGYKLPVSEATLVFGLAVILVYFVLAAQYESWTSPAAVILVVPLALLGTVAAVALRGLDNNVYTQIGIVLIIALASKNAILIVEFARELRHKGKSVIEAAAEAARLRFRPILMTSFAFILGVWPLVIAKGAGAASRQALGTAVFGGMIASTVLAVFFVPVFYVICQHFSEWASPPKHEPEPEAPAARVETPLADGVKSEQVTTTPHS